MKKFGLKTGLFVLFSLFVVTSCNKNNEVTDPSLQGNSSGQDQVTLKNAMIEKTTISVFATGIAFPRELKFGPDGNLYVALAGTGGTNLTTCTQVIAPVGPYKGGNTSSIVKINPAGIVSTVIDKLPSSINAKGFTEGVADVEFVEDKLYVLSNGGCSHGNTEPAAILKVNMKKGTSKVFADLSNYFLNHTVAAPEPDDFEPDGTPYSMVHMGENIYVIEPNHGELVKVSENGWVSRVLDFSAHYGHIVPTVVTVNHGNFYVGNLRTFPLVGGSSNVYKVTPEGDVSIWETGFTGVLGIAFDKQDRLYVLETSAGGGPLPMTGRVVRINKNKTRDVIVDQLMFPTGMTFGPDGALYISNTGFGPPTGSIVKVAFSHGNND